MTGHGAPPLLLLVCLFFTLTLIDARHMLDKKIQLQVSVGGIGDSCSMGNVHGTCVDTRTPNACPTSTIPNKCQGPPYVKCCVKPNIAPKPSKSTDLEKDYPYKFPYSRDVHLVADMKLQILRVYREGNMVKEYKMSSAKNGIGFEPGSNKSPIGKFIISSKIGDKQPLGTVFVKLSPTKIIGKETDKSAHMQTRLFGLQGEDTQNKNSASRGIFIHGTNKESKLGTPDSHGCFRVSNAAAIELFDTVEKGTEFYVVPSNAWPQ